MPSSEHRRLEQKVVRLAEDVSAANALLATLRTRIEAIEDALQLRSAAATAHADTASLPTAPASSARAAAEPAAPHPVSSPSCAVPLRRSRRKREGYHKPYIPS